MSRTILVDGNAIGYAGQHIKRLENGGKPVHAIFHFLKSIMSLKKTYPNDKILVLWDCKAQWRLDLYPDYKSTRSKTEKQIQDRAEYAEQRTIIRELLTHLGVYQVEAQNYEADDLAGFFTRMVTKRGDDVLLVTGDKDWAQLVDRPGIMWFDPRSGGRWIAFDNFQEKTGARNVNEFLQMKAIQGDSSDAIHGISGLGDKAVVNICQSFPSVSSMLSLHKSVGRFDKENSPDSLNSRFIKPLNDLCSEDGKKTFVRNLKLMNLRTTDRDGDISRAVKISKGVRSMDTFFGRCLDLDFNSITSSPNQWLRTFGETA